MFALLVLLGVAFTAAPQPEPGPITVVSATDRLAWDQATGNDVGLAVLSFWIYVDDNRLPAQDVACSRTDDPSTFSCSASMPLMSAGDEHVVQVAARVNGSDIEGERSDPIRLLLVAPPPVDAPGGSIINWTTADGLSLRIETIATGLDDATDMAALEDGRIIVAERAGRIRVVDPRTGVSRDAARFNDAVSNGGEGGLLSIAAFADANDRRAITIHAAYTTAAGLRISRAQIHDSGTSAPVTIRDALPISRTHPHAALRFSADGMLYLATDDGGDPARVRDWGSTNGKILRLTSEGLTPRDALSPVDAIGSNHPGAIAWDRLLNSLWLAGNEGSDSVLTLLSRRITKVFSLGARPSVIGIVRYQENAIPALKGELLVADQEAITRFAIDQDGAPRKISVISHQRLQDLRSMAVANDGSLLLITAENLLRITVQR